MFDFEEGASEVMNPAIEKYESHFKIEFPLYEYLTITQKDHFDFSFEGAKKLTDFIDERIRIDSPVNIPNGYNERLY